MGIFGLGTKGAASLPARTGNLQSQAVDIMATSAGAVQAATEQQTIQLNTAILPATIGAPQGTGTPGVPIVLPAIVPNVTNGGSNLADQARAALDNHRAVFDKIVEKQQPKFLLDNLRRTAPTNDADRLINEFESPGQILRPSIRGKITSPTKLLAKIAQYKTPPASDVLKLPEVRFQNDAFQFISRTGMSAYRPEIVGMVNFERVFSEKQFTTHGLMVSLNYQNKILRKLTLHNIINDLLANSETKDILLTLVQQQDRFFAEIDSVLDIFYGNISSLNKVKNAFELSTLDNKAFLYLTLKTFFEKRMQYDSESYQSFSDTKILLQLLVDFRAVLENYSFNLLNTTDFDRVGDRNPISIDTTYALTNNFNFTIQGIKSTTSSTRKATLPLEFSNFINSLPPKPEDRVKLLLHLLSKELRVSKSLSKQTVRDKIKNYYGGDPDGNPFDNIVGQLGADIFDPVLGNHSLATLFQIGVQNGMVLPFESKTIDDGQTNYMPGSQYFVDNIFSLVNGSSFNLQPLEIYSEEFAQTLSNAKGLLEENFEKFEKSTLAPWPLFWKFLQTFEAGTSNTGNNNPMPEQLLVLALLKLASQNNILKTMLFQFYVLMSVALTSNSDRSKIIDKLINDLGDIRSLTYVKVDPANIPELLAGMSELSPSLEQLAEDIEAQVYTLLIGSRVQNKINAAKSNKSGFKQTSRTDRTPNRVAGDPAYNLLLEPIPPQDSGNPAVQTIAIDSGFIKRILLSTRNTDGNSVPTLLNQLIQFHIFFDSQASIQGNDLSYIFENNSTRFNFISMSYLLLMNFELFSSFTSKFFNAELQKNSEKPNGIRISFNKAVNQEAYDYIDRFTADTPEPYKPLADVARAVGTRIVDSLGSGNASKILNVNPNIFSTTPNANTSTVTPLGNADSDAENQYQNPVFAAAMSVIPNFQYQQPVQGSTIQTGLRAGASNTFSEQDFRNPGATAIIDFSLGSSTVNLRNSAPLPRGRIPATALEFRQTNQVYVTLSEIKTKVSEEDEYIKNVLDILGIIANRLSVSVAEVGFYFKELERSANFANFLRYKENIDTGHLKASSYVWNKLKNSDTSSLVGFDSPEKRNQAFSSERNRVLAMYSLLKTSNFIGKLASSRTKLLAVGLPVGFSSKLIDRIEKTEIKTDTFKDAESDIVYLTVYKKSAEDQDIIFHPQRFMFDLSLYDLDLSNAQIDNNSDFVSAVRRAKVFDFVGKRTPSVVGLDDLKTNKRYSFLSQNQIQELFFNQVVSELLKLYSYYGSGLNISEEVFLENGYTPEIYGGIDNLPEETKTLLTAYYGLKTGNPNVTFDAFKSAFLTSANVVPETIKDNIRILMQGPALLREDYMKKASLEKKKFEKILFVPIDIDSFLIDVEKTRENSSGKRVLQKQSFNDRVTIEKVSNDDRLMYFNRKNEANALVFEDYFVTVQTVRKA